MEAEAIACRRGARLVLDGLSFTLAPGELMLVQGPNGSGKTSLLRLLAGLLPPAAGRLLQPFEAGLLGVEPALKPDLPLEDELRFWARLDGQSAARLGTALELFDLLPLADIPVRLLSTGQRRRAALARLWVADVRLWLLDEPNLGLDQRALERLAEVLRDHLGRGGLAVAASHVPLGVDETIRLVLPSETNDGNQARNPRSVLEREEE